LIITISRRKRLFPELAVVS